MNEENKLEKTNDYNHQRYIRKKQKYRIILGVSEFAQVPCLNLVWVVFIACMILSKIYLQKFFGKLEIPEILAPIYKYIPDVSVIAIFGVLVLAIIVGIAEVKARDDEADVREAFQDYRVDTMPPILIFKKKIKKNMYIRQFYSFITLKEWENKKSEIETCMNVQIIGEIETANNKRIVTLKTFDGNQRKNNKVLYDDEY